jgi:aspartyl-tRNA(Asn)/glutamyl-tRNA(Gln) amidotransferase subunit C
MEKITIDSKLVRHVAHLARLELNEQELAQFTKQLASILEYMEKLQNLDTATVEPTSHAMPLKNVFREDEVKPSLPVKDVLKNAPAKEGNFFKVPKVIEQE